MNVLLQHAQRSNGRTMRVLLVTQWYPPEPQKVVSDIAECIQAAGHSVTVLTGFPNYPAGKLYPGYRIRLWQREELNGVPVIRVPLYPNHSTSAIQRTLNFVSFAASLLVLGPWLVPRVDVVHVYLPPFTISPAAWLISRLFGASLTCEIQDMWPETLKATGMVNDKRALQIVGWLGNWCYRRAARIRVISPGFRDNLIAKGVPADKIEVIPNCVDTVFYRPMPADAEMAKSLALDGRFNVMYAGTIGRAQGLSVVLEAASLLQDLPDVQFVLVGDGTDLAELQEAAKTRGLENVKFLGRYPEEAMPSMLALADVLFVHLRDDLLFRITIPHKVYTYAAVGKPILAAIRGDTADVVQAANAGLTCEPGNPHKLADAVRQLWNLSSTERQAMGDNGRAMVCQSASRECHGVHLVEMLERSVQCNSVSKAKKS
jgi:glycosyltransferase involved in cell wall biosynthesis